MAAEPNVVATFLRRGCRPITIYWLRVFPTEETYLQALVIANLLLLPPDPV
jgi:hypothetical protein